MGLLLPLSSGSPSSIFMTSMPVTFFLPTIFTGETKNWVLTPSASASSISQSKAGISCRGLLYKMVALLPRRRAERAESIAIFPPPMITTLSPKYLGLLSRDLFSGFLTSLKNSIP